MSLREDIERFTEQMAKDMPQKIRSIMQEETDRLAESGVTDRSLGVGDKAPSFTLPNVAGKRVSSAELLAKGPLVVSFYRGGW